METTPKQADRCTAEAAICGQEEDVRSVFF